MNVRNAFSHDRRVRRITSALLLIVLVSSGCRAVVEAHGVDASAAKANADGVAAALEHRFTNVERSPKFSNARMRIARYALAPSKLVNDTSLWTRSGSTTTGAVRNLDVGAAFRGNRFRFTTDPAAPLPDQVGEERHIIRLSQVGQDDWQWATEVDHGVGTMPPQRMDDVARAIFASLERPSASVRADYRTALPKATAAFGRLVVLDSLDSRKQPDGSSLVTATIHIDADRLRPRFPNFAKYVDKYVGPAKYDVRLADKTGAEWFTVQSVGERMVVRFRSHDGELQPLAGATRRMPDTLAITIDAKAKFGIFTVGVSRMQGEFVHVDQANDRSWAMRFTKEPHWHLPLIAERLLRTPLRRPFEGRGVYFKVGFRSSPMSGQTLLSRNMEATVRESAIMRFLGNLGFGAMNEFAGKVEVEENRFIAELFGALRADIRAL